MEGPFCGIVIALFFVTTNGQCSINLGNSPLSSCEGMTKHGAFVYVDFYKINRPCNCTVTPSFDGDLLITSRKPINYACYTEVNIQNKFTFTCPINEISTMVLSVTINQTVDVRAGHSSPPTPGTFHHCMAFQQNGGLNGNLSVMCGSPSATTTTNTIRTTTTTSTTTTITTTTLSSTTITPSTESTSVAITKTNTDVTKSSNTINSSFDSLSMDSKKDDPNMIYIIAGSAAGGAILLVGLIVLILISINGSRSGDKKGSSERGMSNTNEAFDSNAELPDNPLYLSSQPMDELGYSSDQEKQLGLPPTDSKSKDKINPDYDVPPNNKPIYRGESSMPLYAVPKKSNEQTPEVSTGDVYAQVCKPNISTAQLPMRNRHEDGLLYMEAGQDTAGTNRTNTDDKQGVSGGACCAEIKHT